MYPICRCLQSSHRSWSCVSWSPFPLHLSRSIIWEVFRQIRLHSSRSCPRSSCMCGASHGGVLRWDENNVGLPWQFVKLSCTWDTYLSEEMSSKHVWPDERGLAYDSNTNSTLESHEDVQPRSNSETYLTPKKLETALQEPMINLSGD